MNDKNGTRALQECEEGLYKISTKKETYETIYDRELLLRLKGVCLYYGYRTEEAIETLKEAIHLEKLFKMYFGLGVSYAVLTKCYFYENQNRFANIYSRKTISCQNKLYKDEKRFIEFKDIIEDLE